MVPKTWKEGTLTTIYKNKGIKGFPGNDRGITVSSSMVKLMEKLIQTRMVRNVHITECQGGGKKGVGTRDHLTILNSIIRNYRKEKKDTSYNFPRC